MKIELEIQGTIYQKKNLNTIHKFNVEKKLHKMKFGYFKE